MTYLCLISESLLTEKIKTFHNKYRKERERGREREREKERKKKTKKV